MNRGIKFAMTTIIEEIRTFARQCFADAPGSHDWTHTERVHRLCRQIGQCEGADLCVLDIAAYLHDVARPYEDESKGRICHALKGSQMAAELLAKYPISADRKTNIIHCVAAHRFRGNDAPETIEAKVLFDADKLDSIGAVGIGRAFLFAGEVGAKLHNPAIAPETTQAYSQEDTAYREYRLKLSRIKDRMLTAEGRRRAEGRHAFMETFFERLRDEHEGQS